jgi:hypothetical protein
MRRISAQELHERSIRSLAMDSSSLDLTTIEGIAGLLRRAAGFLCPSAETELSDAVFQSLRDLSNDPEHLLELIHTTLANVVAYGDLIESPAPQAQDENSPGTFLYLTPPSFVMRRDGSAFLLGIAPDNLFPLPEDYAKRVEVDGHVKRMFPLPDENLRTSLSQFGLFELPMEQWVRTPFREPAQEHVLRFNNLLGLASSSGDVSGIRILEPSKPVRYYPGRWTESRNQTGRFVARRPQAYGAELWCYFQLENGHPQKFIDLPAFEKRWRACDEAWRLQAAIDACNSTPQQFRVRSGPTNTTSVLDLFSPVPAWAQRRWDLVGRSVPRNGTLLSYVLPTSAVKEEIDFMKSLLWLVDLKEAG